MAKASRHEGSHDQEPWAIAFSARDKSMRSDQVEVEVQGEKQKANRQTDKQTGPRLSSDCDVRGRS